MIILICSFTKITTILETTKYNLYPIHSSGMTALSSGLKFRTQCQFRIYFTDLPVTLTAKARFLLDRKQLYIR